MFVDGVGTLKLKGGGLAGVGEVAPSKGLVGGVSPCPSALRASEPECCASNLATLLPSFALLSAAAGAALTACAQVKG